MTKPDLTHAIWRTSTRSGGNGNCVEVATNLSGLVAIRDSKNPHGLALTISPAHWCKFTTAVQANQA
jgi:hypothetical protein